MDRQQRHNNPLNIDSTTSKPSDFGNVSECPGMIYTKISLLYVTWAYDTKSILPV